MSGVRAAVVDEHGALLGTGRAAGRSPRDRGSRRGRSARVAARRPSRPVPRRWPRRAWPSTRSPCRRSDRRPCSSRSAGEAVSPALLFGLDRRAEEQRARLGLNHDHALPKLLWWAEHEPERVARAATAVDAAGFVVAGLCGELVMDSITAEAYTAPGIEPPLPLPPPCDPLSRAGGLLPRPAAALGVWQPARRCSRARSIPTRTSRAPPPRRAPGACCSARRSSSMPSRPSPSPFPGSRCSISRRPASCSAGRPCAAARRSPGWTACSARAPTTCTPSRRAPAGCSRCRISPASARPSTIPARAGRSSASPTRRPRPRCAGRSSTRWL